MLCKKMLWLLMLVFLLVLLAGCSSNEENPIAPTPKSEPPEFALKEVSFPQSMTSSTHTMAKKAIEMVTDAMNFDGTGAFFTAPTGAQVLLESKVAWEYSWDTANLNRRLAITLLSGQYKWQLYYTGTANNVTFDNWRFMEAVQKTDKSNGHIYMYRENTGQIVQEWVWYTLEKDEYKFVAQDFGDAKSKIEITLKADTSGKVEFYLPSTSGGLVYNMRMSWDAQGAGAWWTYDNGVQKESGTW